MLLSHQAIDVVESSQVGQARRAAVRMAELCELTDQKCGEVAIIATELATNLARYGKDGRFFLQSVDQPGASYVEMLAVDSGPGIADVPHSMQDGVSTGGTPGTGLGAVRRMSDVFDIYSGIGQGTLVLARVTRGQSTTSASANFHWSAVSTPAPREMECGDIWRVAEDGETLTVMVADGLGHGPLAAEAANRAAALFDAATPTDPAGFCDQAHIALNGSRGAALAIGRVTANRVTYAGVGNISGSLVGDEKSRGLSSQNGTVGVTVRRTQAFTYDWPERGVLVMHSDGLSSRWSLNRYQGLAARHPALIAGVLYRDCLRGRDDATVVVVKKATSNR
jgi:anti-sigma regulatory factor (Ser/Thr protein kinase)